MDTEDRLLVEILGRQDALWLPRRAADLSFTADSNYCAAQQAFATSGVPWQSQADSEAGRKSDRRRLEYLASCELIRLDGSTKTLHVKLTPEGENYTRSAVGLFGLVESHAATCAVLRHAGAGWCCETILITNSRTATYGSLGRRAGRLLAAHDGIMLPALCRGFVRSNSDSGGRVFFKITEAGLEWIVSGEPKQPSGLPGPDEEALMHYMQTRNERRVDLRNSQPVNPAEIGLPPLPVGCPMIRGPDGVSDPPPRRRKRARVAKSSEKSNA